MKEQAHVEFDYNEVVYTIMALTCWDGWAGSRNASTAEMDVVNNVVIKLRTLRSEMEAHS